MRTLEKSRLQKLIENGEIEGDLAEIIQSVFQALEDMDKRIYEQQKEINSLVISKKSKGVV